MDYAGEWRYKVQKFVNLEFGQRYTPTYAKVKRAVMRHAHNTNQTLDFVRKDSVKIVEDAQQDLFDPADCRIIEIVESVQRQMKVFLDPTQGPFPTRT